MIYVYLIESVHQRQQNYVGITNDLKQRLADHNAGKSPHTRKFKPWRLVVYLGFADELSARAFEKYLKSGSGKAFLKKRYLRLSPRPYDSFPSANTFDRRGFLTKLSPP